MPNNHYIHFGAPIVIEAGVNNLLRIYDDAAWKDATITPGIYYTAGLVSDHDSFYTALETACNTDGNGDWVFAGDSSPLQIYNSSSAWKIDFGYGTGYFGEWRYLGLEESLIAEGTADWVIALKHPQYTWFPQADPTSGPAYNLVTDTFARMQHSAAQSVAKSGKVWTIKPEDDYHTRSWDYTNLYLYQLYPTSGYTNRSWVLWLEEANNGERIKVWEYISGGARREYGYLDRNTASYTTIKKIQPGIDLYSLTISMTRAYTYGFAL